MVYLNMLINTKAGINTKIWLRIFIPNMPRIFKYLELDDFWYGLPYINIAVAESAVCLVCFCLLPVCALVEVLPHIRFTTAHTTKTSAAMFSAGHYQLIDASLPGRIPFFGQAVGNTVVTLPQTSVKNSLFHVVIVYHFQLCLPLSERGESR